MYLYLILCTIFPIRTPIGLEDVSKYPALFEALVKNGWTQYELELVKGGNIIRVFSEVEKVSSVMQHICIFMKTQAPFYS